MKTFKYAKLVNPLLISDNEIIVDYQFQDVEEVGYLLFTGQKCKEDCICYQDECKWELIRYGSREYLLEGKVKFTNLIRGLQDTGCCIVEHAENVREHQIDECLEINPVTDYDFCEIRDLINNFCTKVKDCICVSGMLHKDENGCIALDALDFRNLIHAEGPISYDPNTGTIKESGAWCEYVRSCISGSNLVYFNQQSGTITLNELGVKQLFSGSDYINFDPGTGVISLKNICGAIATCFGDSEFIGWDGNGDFSLNFSALRRALITAVSPVDFNPIGGEVFIRGDYFITGRNPDNTPILSTERIQNGAVIESRNGVTTWNKPWTPLDWTNNPANQQGIVTLDCGKYYRFYVKATGIIHFNPINFYPGQIAMVTIVQNQEFTHTWESFVLPEYGEYPESPKYTSQYGLTVDLEHGQLGDPDLKIYLAIISEGNKDPSWPD